LGSCPLRCAARLSCALCTVVQTFVHDPKMSNTTEVKAQIKLRLSNNDMSVMVVRSLQVRVRQNNSIV
jgi:hypothetical protein